LRSSKSSPVTVADFSRNVPVHNSLFQTMLTRAVLATDLVHVRQSRCSTGKLVMRQETS
ncbi:hypothetical protein RvY_12051, partial [Ramazzottius varieornatus]